MIWYIKIIKFIISLLLILTLASVTGLFAADQPEEDVVELVQVVVHQPLFLEWPMPDDLHEMQYRNAQRLCKNFLPFIISAIPCMALYYVFDFYRHDTP